MRNKIITLLLTLVIAALVGTVFFTTRTFLQDKRNYITELNSITAPHIALLISKTLLNFRDQLKDIDQNKAQELFKKYPNIEELNVYDRNKKLFFSAGRSKTAEDDFVVTDSDYNEKPDSFTLEPYTSNESSGGSFIFKTNQNGQLYVVILSKDIFKESFNLSRALPVSLVTKSGSPIVGNSPMALHDPIIINEVKDLYNKHQDERVLARIIEVSDHRKTLLAMAPVPFSLNTAVVIEVPDAQTSQMAAQVLKDSLPFILGVLILVLVLGILFSSQLTKPLEDLTQATSSIAAGQWNVLVKTKSRDEIGKLITAFNKMGSELATREDELNKAHVQLLRSERLAALGKFSAGIAHEIKNPLTSILTYSQLIQRQLGDDKTHGEESQFASFIIEETRRANGIVTDLLTFARQKTPTLSPENLPEILDHSIELLKPQAQSFGVEIQKHYNSSENIIVKADRNQIYQVLQNLIVNAIQAMEKNPPGSRSIQVGIVRNDRNVIFSVRDSGPGISDENKSRIFEPFFSTKETGKGTGLGLSLVMGIVEQHGGKIEVKSETGKGATFNVQLLAA